jgi:Tol biopolymer transport system component
VFAPVKGGKTRVIAKNAADPAVSPDGKQLAYVGYQDSSGCGNPRSLVVEKARKNGRASSGKSWASPAEDGGVVAPSWAPDSRHVHFLFVGGNGIVTSQVLDTDQAQSLDDAQPIALPADVRPYGYFGATGELLGVDFTGPSSIVVIDPDTGGISRVLFPVSDRIFAPQSATASARGQNVLYLAPGPEGRIGLYVWQAVAPTPVAFTEGILAATFLPIDQEP